MYVRTSQDTLSQQQQKKHQQRLLGVNYIDAFGCLAILMLLYPFIVFFVFHHQERNRRRPAHLPFRTISRENNHPTFQSSSPSSIIARHPRGLMAFTSLRDKHTSSVSGGRGGGVEQGGVWVCDHFAAACRLHATSSSTGARLGCSQQN